MKIETFIIEKYSDEYQIETEKWNTLIEVVMNENGKMVNGIDIELSIWKIEKNEDDFG